MNLLVAVSLLTCVTLANGQLDPQCRKNNVQVQSINNGKFSVTYVGCVGATKNELNVSNYVCLTAKAGEKVTVFDQTNPADGAAGKELFSTTGIAEKWQQITCWPGACFNPDPMDYHGSYAGLNIIDSNCMNGGTIGEDGIPIA